jgi:hypothetical protein
MIKSQPHSLTSLDIRNTKGTKSGLSAVFQALKERSTPKEGLVYLNVAENKLGQCLDAFVLALPLFTFMKELNLSDTALSVISPVIDGLRNCNNFFFNFF